MSEVLQANIFFLITSIAVGVLTILGCVLLYQVIKIVRSLRRIIERVEAGSEVIAEDISDLRTFVLEGSLLSQLIGFFVSTKSTSKRRSKAKSDDA